jgi:hypothetical protein
VTHIHERPLHSSGDSIRDVSMAGIFSTDEVLPWQNLRIKVGPPSVQCAAKMNERANSKKNRDRGI